MTSSDRGYQPESQRINVEWLIVSRTLPHGVFHLFGASSANIRKEAEERSSSTSEA